MCITMLLFVCSGLQMTLYSFDQQHKMPKKEKGLKQESPTQLIKCNINFS